jgi:hypothetical protein
VKRGLFSPQVDLPTENLIMGSNHGGSDRQILWFTFSSEENTVRSNSRFCCIVRCEEHAACPHGQSLDSATREIAQQAAKNSNSNNFIEQGSWQCSLASVPLQEPHMARDLQSRLPACFQFSANKGLCSSHFRSNIPRLKDDM